MSKFKNTSDPDSNPHWLLLIFVPLALLSQFCPQPASADIIQPTEVGRQFSHKTPITGTYKIRNHNVHAQPKYIIKHKIRLHKSVKNPISPLQGIENRRKNKLTANSASQPKTNYAKAADTLHNNLRAYLAQRTQEIREQRNSTVREPEAKSVDPAYINTFTSKNNADRNSGSIPGFGLEDLFSDGDSMAFASVGMDVLRELSSAGVDILKEVSKSFDPVMMNSMRQQMPNNVSSDDSLRNVREQARAKFLRPVGGVKS